MKAIILARVSTKEQQEEGYSIPAQVRRLTDFKLLNPPV
jgi:DNA invertase Pin-like site-specific DNA recombinase